MMGDRNCNTTEYERGISCTEQYSKVIEVKLHRPRMTSITCLQQLSAVKHKGNESDQNTALTCFPRD